MNLLNDFKMKIKKKQKRKKTKLFIMRVKRDQK